MARSRCARGLTLAVLLLAGLGVARPASANPLDAFGFGSRGAAMGSAAAADVQDFSANYYNPAGLALARSLEVSLGYFRADSYLYMNGQNNQVDPVHGLVGGLVAPGQLFGVPFAFGLGLHLPDQRLSRVRALPQDQPVWELYDNRNQRVYLAANLAVSPFKWLQIGGGLSFMAATAGSVDITGNVDVLKVESSEVRNQVSADLTAIRYPQVGARIAVNDRLAFALVYRGQFRLTLDLDATLAGDISLGAAGTPLTTALYTLQTDSVNAFLPQQVVVGSSWSPIDDLKVDLDLTWVNWSAYVAPVAQVSINLDIPPPQGGWPASISPPTTPVATAVIPIVMHDRVVPHVGAEWRAIVRPKYQGFLRAGYEFDQSPIAPQTGQTNYVDRDRHAFSAGVGVRLVKLTSVLPGDVRVDAHGQLSVLPTSLTLKSDPSDLVGDYTAGGHIWNVGGTVTVGF
jgi:long-chain fatty acid transport protein